MVSIVLPERVVLRLVDSEGNALRVRNVLFTIRIFATRKNDFNLGPFASNDDGIVTITKKDLVAEAAAHYDTGLMDYDRVENCKPMVTIAPMQAVEIEKALDARTRVWTMLLGGEPQRWGSIDDVRHAYRTAANKSISANSISAQWDGKALEYEYAVIASVR